jgi:hypothetical protein
MEKSPYEICDSEELCDSDKSGPDVDAVNEKLLIELDQIKSDRDLYKRLYEEQSFQAFKYRNAFKALVEEITKK